jgi:hypothetical protein
LGRANITVGENFLPQAQSGIYENVKEVSFVYPLGNASGLAKNENWTNTKTYPVAKNCDLFDRGSVRKDISTSGGVYSAEQKGVNCDYENLAGFLKDVGYIIRFKGINEDGRSLKVVMNNNSTRVNEIEYLLNSGSFDSVFSLLPYSSDHSYDLNIETRSFGEKSVNKLSDIEYFPFPIYWLSSVTVKTPEAVKAGGDVAFGGVNKKGTGYYLLNVKDVSGEPLITLAQGYEDGWIAYEVSERSSALSLQLTKILPFFSKKLEHVKVNGWANGWLVKPSDISPQPSVTDKTDNRQPTAESSIVIVYWPQYLEYLGFVILLVTIISFAFPERTRSLSKLLKN